MTVSIKTKVLHEFSGPNADQEIAKMSLITHSKGKEGMIVEGK